MTKKSKILIFTTIVFLGFVVFIAAWQWNNIVALYEYMLYSNDEIESKIRDSKDDLQESLEKYVPNIDRDFTVEEEEKIRTGELSPEDALGLIADSSSTDASDVVSGDKPAASTPTPNVSTSPPDTDMKENEESQGIDQQEVNRIISKYVAKLYLYKAQYIAKLGQLERSAKAEYLALPAEKQNSTGKNKILLSKMSEAAAMEKECDAEVKRILEVMKTELTAAGGDLSIIDVINKAYEEEKSLKKAQYVETLN